MLFKNCQYSLVVGNAKTGDGVVINNLQMTFDVSKSDSNKDKSNSASIEIYNLSDDTLRLIDVDFPAASFSAGYADVGIKILFQGQVTLVTTRKSGSDRVTQIQMGSAYTELNHQVLSELIAPGRTVKDVVETIRNNMPGVVRGVYNGTNLNNQILYGYPLMGTPKEMLDELSSKYRVSWQVNGDTLYVHDMTRGNTENFTDAYVVSRYSGLIENAYRVSGESGKSKKDETRVQGVQWKMLLNPDVVPGDIIKLEDGTLSGWYKITDLRHYGDWRGNDWYTEVRATAIEKVIKE